MPSIAGTLLSREGVAQKSELIAAGLTSRQIANAVHRGEAHRPRRGWYAHSSASDDLVRAVRVGGRMACLTAARSYGLWVLDDGRTHVHVPESASRLRSRDNPTRRLVDRDADGTRIHREMVAPITSHTRLRVSLLEALAEIIGHGGFESSIVALDSAASRGLLPRRSREALEARLPAKYRPLLGGIRAEAESGIETLVRVRLEHIGLSPSLQVRIADDIRVDLLLGERLIIETDGREFHDDSEAFEADRRRDLFLKAFGFEVLRLSYRQVMRDWPSCEAAIVRMVASRRHLRLS